MQTSFPRSAPRQRVQRRHYKAVGKSLSPPRGPGKKLAGSLSGAAHSRLAFLRLLFIQLCCYQPSRLCLPSPATRCAAESSLRLHKIRTLNSLSLRQSFFSRLTKGIVKRTGDFFWLGLSGRVCLPT